MGRSAILFKLIIITLILSFSSKITMFNYFREPQNIVLGASEENCLVIETISIYESIYEINCGNSFRYRIYEPRVNTEDSSNISKINTMKNLNRDYGLIRTYSLEISDLNRLFPSIVGDSYQTKQTKTNVLDLNSNDQWQCYIEGGPACYSNIYDIQMVGHDEAWAVGDGGIILHFLNGEWETYSKPHEQGKRYLHSVSMLSNNDGWAVGFHEGCCPQHALALNWNGYYWVDTELPTFDTLYSVSAISHENVWVVGYPHINDMGQMVGVISQWNGSQWQVIYEPEVLPQKIHMIGLDDGWIVSWDRFESISVLLHWNGISWSEVNNPTINKIAAFDFLSTNDGWAVGEGGTILHWDGSLWGVVDSPTTNNLSSIEILSDNNIWIMGVEGTILHWDGSIWEIITGPTAIEILSVTMYSPTSGLAAGYRGAILRWDGNEWINISAPEVHNFTDLSMVSLTDGWGVAFDPIVWRSYFYHYNGTSWMRVNSPISSVFSVDMITENDGWATGWEDGTSYILHWDGFSWEIRDNPVSTTTLALTDVAMVSPIDGWIVGQDSYWWGGNVITLHWNGIEWNLQTNNLYDFESAYDILPIATNDVWVVGSRIVSVECGGETYYYPAVIHWNGNNWENNNPPEDDKFCGHILYGAGGVASNDVWTTFQLNWDGEKWRDFFDPFKEGRYFTSFSMSSQEEGWAVGDYDPMGWYSFAQIAYWDGFNWKNVVSPTSVGLSAVSMNSPNEGWAVGAGAIIHFDGLPPVRQRFFLPKINK
jgi:photosystem II stability/assembly factor-like uncharacterized protein